MEIIDVLSEAISSHFAAGAAGGLVRVVHLKEEYSLAVIRSIAGGTSAFYVTPTILWALPKFVEISQNDLVQFSSIVGQSTSFFVGLIGIAISISVGEKLVSKWFKL